MSNVPWLLPSSVVSPVYINGTITLYKTDTVTKNNNKYYWYTDIMKSMGILVIDENCLSEDAKKYIEMNKKYYRLFQTQQLKKEKVYI